jgi:hypothetical protein
MSEFDLSKFAVRECGRCLQPMPHCRCVGGTLGFPTTRQQELLLAVQRTRARLIKKRDRLNVRINSLNEYICILENRSSRLSSKSR